MALAWNYCMVNIPIKSKDKNRKFCETNRLLQEVHYDFVIQFLRLFHECDLYGYLIFDCEASNWAVMKALRRFLCSNFKECIILAKAFSFWLAFLQRDLTWGSNISLLFIRMLRSFSHLLLDIAIPPILIWISCVEFFRRCDFFWVCLQKTFGEPFD